MLFTSVPFFLFFAVVFLGLRLLPRHDHKINWLILAGAFFYGYWDWRFLALIGFTSVFDFWMGLKIGEASGKRRKTLLTIDIAINLGILCYFKYANFFLSSFEAVLAPLGIHFDALNILLPIGISFFVFEAMSYCIDIYRGTIEPYRNWRHFALFIFFFPRMIAGPIIRPADFLPQLSREIAIKWPNVVVGGQLFLMGMTKKLVIADHLAPFVDAVFANPEHYSAGSIWQAVVGYSIQIFCDFSGYSDMAIGLAVIMGFTLPVNFRVPYVSTSITEFWRRWHISLSSWLRDYLYIPLGGNRKGTFRTYLNLMITMTLGGLWHGANWTFVVWGILHGIGLAVHKAYSGLPLVKSLPAQNPLIKAVSWMTTFLFVCIGWVFFRSQTFVDAKVCLERMFGVEPGGLAWTMAWLWLVLPVVIFGHVVALSLERRQKSFWLVPARFGHLVALCCWILGIFLLAATNTAPFIYFQF